MKRVVVAMDSFKGSLSSVEAGAALAEGVRSVYADAVVNVVPIADGGEGTEEAVAVACGGRYHYAEVTDPLGRSILARYVTINDDTTAIIALAAASGLTLLSDEERNPLIATTYGTGELILDALRRGCRDVVVGLGGSATTDGGVGMLRALGYRFYDAGGEELCGATIDILERVARVDDSGVCGLLQGATLRAMVDVDNPLTGPRGAANIFARQKGAADEDVERLDRALCRYAHVVDVSLGRTGADVYGSGAAGGVGFAFHTVLGCELISGIELILDFANVNALIADADLVVTGEGRIDTQTLMGKAPSGVLRRAERCGVPCVAVGGSVDRSAPLDGCGFAGIYDSMPESMLLSEAMVPDCAKENLRSVGRRVAIDFFGV